MKLLSTLVLLFVSVSAFSQISFSGVSDAKQETDNSQNTVFDRSKLVITKKNGNADNVVLENRISNSSVTSNSDAVRINIDPSGANTAINRPANALENEMDYEEYKKRIVVELEGPRKVNSTTEPPVTNTVVEVPTTTTTVVEPPVTNTVVEVPTTTATVVEPPVTNTVVEVPTTTATVVEPPVTNTVVEVPTTTTTVVEVPTTTATVVDIDSSLYCSKNLSKQEAFERNEDAFPGKKKGTWAVGLNGGYAFVMGDVASKPGYGASLTVQKALGHVVSLRFQGMFAETYGLDWRTDLNDDVTPTHRNYKTRISDYTLQGVFTLNNINFYKRQPKVIFNVMAGVGFSTRYTWTNMTDADGNAYDFSSVPVVADRGDRGDVYDALDNLMDDGFETGLDANMLEAHIKNTDINPSVMLGAGLGFRLSKNVDLNIEHRISWHNEDMLDGYGANNNKDLLNYTSLGLNFKLGKKEETMWWTNPVATTYDDVRDLKKNLEDGEFLQDVDQDGVLDVLDKDLNTPPMIAVDSRGVASDLDKDGVPDYLDKEPFTAIGASVDGNGVARDSDKDGVADVYDMEPNTNSGAFVDANGREIIVQSQDLGAELAVVFFDVNSSSVQKDYYGELYEVLTYARNNPSANFVVTGYTDVRAGENYNMKLSESRANEVYRMLTEVFKVSSAKIEKQYKGESDQVISGLPENVNSKYEAAYAVNRRVTIHVK